MEDLDRRLIRCFRLVFPELSEAQVPSACRENTSRWDSLVTVNLLTVIFEEFGIEATPESLVSYEKVHELLSRRS